MGADQLFDEPTTSAIVATCAEEMSLLGYTREGTDESWTAVDVADAATADWATAARS